MRLFIFFLYVRLLYDHIIYKQAVHHKFSSMIPDIRDQCLVEAAGRTPETVVMTNAPCGIELNQFTSEVCQ